MEATADAAATVEMAAAALRPLRARKVAAGCQGPHPIAAFAHSLNHAQRRQLRRRPRPGQPRQSDVPAERTFRRLLKRVKADQLKDVLVAWMRTQDPTPPAVVCLDGKVLKNAPPAPARATAPPSASAPAEPCEIPPALPSPNADRALMLVNMHTPDQRLIDQIVVPADTNEEAAVAVHLPQMDLAGVCVTTDAAHVSKANCRQLTQGNGADFFLCLKANQPTALAKAEQLLPGALPPSGHDGGQRPRAD